MNRRALCTALRAAGVRDGHYHVEGVHEPAPPPTDFLSLRRSPTAAGRWEVGACERGRWETISRHLREEDACAHLFQLLTGRRPPG